MIQANELRVGNYVKTSSSDIPYLQIEYGYEIDYASSYNDAIPLTPEILEKAGFINSSPDDDELDVFSKDAFPYLIEEIEETKGYKIILYDGLNRYIRLRSLHHLQNCYYLLTGEELIINL